MDNYLFDSNTIALEEFMNYSSMMIANEGIKESIHKFNKWAFVNIGLRSLKSPIGLRNQLNTHKKVCKKRLEECNSPSDCDDFENFLNKNIRMVQRKINGKEIKHKKVLHEHIELYNMYLHKVQQRRKELEKM